MWRLRVAQNERTVQQAGLTSRQALQSAAIQETEFRLADLRQLVQKIQGEAERLIERREQLLVQIRELDEEDGRLGGEITAIGERRVAIGAEREDTTRGTRRDDRGGARGQDPRAGGGTRAPCRVDRAPGRSRRAGGGRAPESGRPARAA